jgi:hypothetical protein
VLRPIFVLDELDLRLCIYCELKLVADWYFVYMNKKKKNIQHSPPTQDPVALPHPSGSMAAN